VSLRRQQQGARVIASDDARSLHCQLEHITHNLMFKILFTAAQLISIPMQRVTVRLALAAAGSTGNSK
jgi:hypothetical protein